MAAVLGSAPAASAGPLTGRLLVSLSAAPKGGAHASAVKAMIARWGAVPQGPSVPQIGLVTVRARAGISIAALARALRRQPGVRAVSTERRYSLRDVPNDPALSAPETAPLTPSGTPVQWWALRENLPHAWDFAHGDGARVAIIDSGVDQTHPELGAKVDRTTDLDSDPEDGPATADEVGHGTHVAGLACATAGNGAGLVGAGYDCHLIVEKSDLTEASVILAIVDATDNGAVAINMSFGTDGSSSAPAALDDAVSYAFRHNVVLIAAAADSPVQDQGDPANVLQPAGTGPNLDEGEGLDVTSANFANQRSSFAGLGSEISLAAYGSFYDSPSQGGPPGIFSAFPANSTALERGSLSPPQGPCPACRTTFQGDSRYAYLAGTSMAAPEVAGTAALIRELNPDLTAAQVISLLKQTATRPAGGGWSPDLGWGILNAGAAVDAARVIDRRPPVSRLRAPAKARASVVTLSWTGADPAPPGLIASGIDHYEIFRELGSRRAVRIATLPAGTTSLRVRVSPGRSYGWYSVAVDAAGNREAAKSAPDARTRVSGHRAAARRRGTPRRHGAIRRRRAGARGAPGRGPRRA